MNKAYRIYFENENYRKYFQNYATLTDPNIIIQKENARMFFDKGSAKECIENIIRTMKNNKSKRGSFHKNKFERFVFENPSFRKFEIEEVKFEEVYFTIQLDDGGNFIWLFGIENDNISYAGDEIKAYKFRNYDDVKYSIKILKKKYEYTNSEIFVKHNYIKENPDE